MPDSNPQEFFVERVANLSHANGVFRITFAQQSEGETLQPTVRLMIPANQMSGILQGIANAAKDIGEQVQARVAENAATTTGEPAAKEKPKAPTKKN